MVSKSKCHEQAKYQHMNKQQERISNAECDKTHMANHLAMYYLTPAHNAISFDSQQAADKKLPEMLHI